ncbi:MAG: F0F1 ATP synthase subunit B [Calditrichales bacterium]|nr:MAG: F0F1 ATP synthase subunit B [Calditrichales bacterium]
MLQLDPGVMIWAWITFFILLLLLYKIAWKPILAIVDKREKTVQDALDRSAKAREEAEAILEKHSQMVLAAEGESQRILKETRVLAEKSRQEILDQAKQSADNIVRKAKAEIEKEKEDALAALRSEVADLAIAAAGKIIGESLDDAKQRVIVNEFIQKMPKSTQI